MQKKNYIQIWWGPTAHGPLSPEILIQADYDGQDGDDKHITHTMRLRSSMMGLTAVPSASKPSFQYSTSLWAHLSNNGTISTSASLLVQSVLLHLAGGLS